MGMMGLWNFLSRPHPGHPEEAILQDHTLHIAVDCSETCASIGQPEMLLTTLLAKLTLGFLEMLPASTALCMHAGLLHLMN